MRRSRCCARSASTGRSMRRSRRCEYQRYAQQVPDHFSFVVKAPALVCDAVMRDEEGRGKVPNPHFLDAAIAAREFVVPCLEGLGAKAGPLVFQVSPLPRGLVEEAATVIERLAAFFAALPQELGRHRPIYALELRNAELLTPRLMRMLASGRRALLRRPARPHARGRAPGGGAQGARRRHAGCRWWCAGTCTVASSTRRPSSATSRSTGWSTRIPKPADPGPHGRRRLQGRPQGLDHRQQQGRGQRAAVAAQTGRGNRRSWLASPGS